MTAIVHWLLSATCGAARDRRERRRQRACNSMLAALRESDGIGDDACTFTCPRCDDSRPRAQCTCLGDCGRRDCPWGEADRDLEVLRSEDAFDAAIAQLHAELDAAEGGNDA